MIASRSTSTEAGSLREVFLALLHFALLRPW